MRPPIVVRMLAHPSSRPAPATVRDDLDALLSIALELDEALTSAEKVANHVDPGVLVAVEHITSKEKAT